MFNVKKYLRSDLSESEARAMLTLIDITWPNEEKTISEMVQELLVTSSPQDTPEYVHFVIWEEERVIAHASSFPRQIYTPQGTLTIMALSGVCVELSQRGKGLGHAVTQAVFKQVDDGVYPASLYQTGVPIFYEKLGAKKVHNQFMNSKNVDNPQANPWWDDHVMIYPANYSWPEGIIDLNGAGY